MLEFDRIARYFAPLATSDGAAGLLDDLAKLSGASTMITVDALVEGVHFLPDDPIDTIARKLVRVNVSDVIAKGGLPSEALLTLGWPKSRTEGDLSRFARAFGEELALWGARLIGGDTVNSPHGLFLSLTLTASPAGPRAPIRRSGGSAGDTLWLSGPIGAGSTGLRDARDRKDTPARALYRVPDIPPLSLARLVATYATASMDVSDGLIGDAAKLLSASRSGGHIALDQVVLHEATSDLEQVMSQCTGGDDYQCLFAVPESVDTSILADRPGVYAIGRLEDASGLRLTWNNQPMDMPAISGFTH